MCPNDCSDSLFSAPRIVVNIVNYLKRDQRRPSILTMWFRRLTGDPRRKRIWRWPVLPVPYAKDRDERPLIQRLAKKCHCFNLVRTFGLSILSGTMLFCGE